MQSYCKVLQYYYKYKFSLFILHLKVMLKLIQLTFIQGACLKYSLLATNPIWNSVLTKGKLET